MTEIALYSLHESQSGKQELVHAIWQRHFHAPTVNCKGLITSTYQIDSIDPNQSHIRFVFSEREYLEAFDTNISYIQYIWEVLPLLIRKPIISQMTTFENHGDAVQTGKTGEIQNNNELSNIHAHHLISDLLVAINRKIHHKQAW
jgi:hypothetical protein